MPSPKVSCIITTHNRKALLLCAVRSVEAQTYENIECIVVDDASSDGTKLAIAPFLERGVRYIRIPEEESRGGNYARNVGIKNATGSYIAFLDDDDEWFETKIERQVEYLERNKNAMIAYCGVIRETDHQITSRVCDDVSDIRRYASGDLAREVLMRIIIITSTIMIRRDVLSLCGMFDEKLDYWQEYEFTIRVLQQGEACFVPENLVLYRILTKDPQRLSNRIAGWEKSVEYIEIKHARLFAALDDYERATRAVYICIDGFNRGKAAKRWDIMLKYAVRAASSRLTRAVVFDKFLSKKRRPIIEDMISRQSAQ